MKGDIRYEAHEKIPRLFAGVCVCHRHRRGASVTAEAKTTYLKTKKVTMYNDQVKTITTPKKIRSLYVENRDPDKVKKTGAKKFQIMGFKDCEYDYQAVREDTIIVTYTDGTKQKYKITLIIRYAQKIANELKPLLADPDAGFRKLAKQYCPDDKVAENGIVWPYKLVRYRKKNEGKGIDAMDGGAEYPPQTSLDEMLADMTVSQKEAAILELYFTNHMTYDGSYQPGTDTYESVYNGTFRGACGNAAYMVFGVCDLLGYEVRYFSSAMYDHAWTCIAGKDANGKKYWEGIAGTSFACNVVWKYKGEELIADEPGFVMLDYIPANYCDVVSDSFSYSWSVK